jgi:hypothetical protein
LYPEQGRDNVWHGAAYQCMVRSAAHKLVVYPGEAYGELYDLEADPREVCNLWESKAHAGIRARLMEEAAMKFKRARGVHG